MFSSTQSCLSAGLGRSSTSKYPGNFSECRHPGGTGGLDLGVLDAGLDFLATGQLRWLRVRSVQSAQHSASTNILSTASTAAQRQQFSRLATGDLLDTIGPALQRNANLISIVMLLIDTDDAAERARHMIECFLDHRHRDPELLHAAGAGPAQIMQPPAARGDPCLGTNPVLHLVPVVHRPLTVSAEHEIAAGEPQACLDQRPSLGA